MEIGESGRTVGQKNGLRKLPSPGVVKLYAVTKPWGKVDFDVIVSRFAGLITRTVKRGTMEDTMKKILMSALAMVVMLVSLSGCYWGYPGGGRGGDDRGDRNERHHDHDRDGGQYDHDRGPV